ncbi:MAG TPA: pilin [Candidatus Dojkabacteria bacterium]|nr:pilin [Candidatus Dojkabacteria bacterium]
MKKSGIIGSLLVPFCILMLDKTAVFAAGDDEPPRLEQLFSTLEIIFQKLSPIAGILCIIFIVLGGYMWMTSAGDPIKIKKAQGTLTWAIIGLVFIVISGIILSVILNLVS